MAAVFPADYPLGPQLIDSCASCFRHKMGLHTYVGNPILYYINMQSLWRDLRFAAKRNAKCR